MKKLFLVAALAFMDGCASIEQEEAAAHAALVKLEGGIDWAAANTDAINAVLDDAAKASGDAGLQKAITKAKAAIAAGDLVTAKNAVHLGAALTAPVASGQ